MSGIPPPPIGGIAGGAAIAGAVGSSGAAGGDVGSAAGGGNGAAAGGAAGIGDGGRRCTPRRRGRWRPVLVYWKRPRASSARRRDAVVASMTDRDRQARRTLPSAELGGDGEWSRPREESATAARRSAHRGQPVRANVVVENGFTC